MGVFVEIVVSMLGFYVFSLVELRHGTSSNPSNMSSFCLHIQNDHEKT